MALEKKETKRKIKTRKASIRAKMQKHRPTEWKLR